MNINEKYPAKDKIILTKGYNKLLNPTAFREFKFREWKMASIAHAGMWLDCYEKMNWRQKLLFNLFGKIPEKFKPNFSFYMDEMTGIDKEGKEIYVAKKVDLRGFML